MGPENGNKARAGCAMGTVVTVEALLTGEMIKPEFVKLAEAMIAEAKAEFKKFTGLDYDGLPSEKPKDEQILVSLNSATEEIMEMIGSTYGLPKHKGNQKEMRDEIRYRVSCAEIFNLGEEE